MALQKDVYRALEDITGVENISEEPALLEAYCRSYNRSAAASKYSNQRLPMFEAVLLPGNTKEVQAVVKVCNRFKVRYHAFSSGYGPFMNSLEDGNCIGLDMKRMNRILEINEKAMYAVVEPCVMGCQFFPEVTKRGLIGAIIGPGTTCTVFPIRNGDGHFGYTTSGRSVNMMGLEWVLPTGEILRTGSLGAGAGWFCGEGAGPSLRALAMGATGTEGGLGVFTTAATRLSHWEGPPVLAPEGVSPNLGVNYPRLGVWAFNLPSYQAVEDVAYKLSESRILLGAERMPSYYLGGDCARTKDEHESNFRELYAETEARGRVGGYVVEMAAETDMEFQYKEKVLMHIIKEVGGELLRFIHDNPERRDMLLLRRCKHTTIDRACRRGGGARAYGISGEVPGLAHALELGVALKKKMIKEGKIWDDGGDFAHGGLLEWGKDKWAGQIACVHTTDEGWTALDEYCITSFKMTLDSKNKLHAREGAAMWNIRSKKQLEKLTPVEQKHFEILTKVKNTIDPNWVSDSSWYLGRISELPGGEEEAGEIIPSFFG